MTQHAERAYELRDCFERETLPGTELLRPRLHSISGSLPTWRPKRRHLMADLGRAGVLSEINPAEQAQQERSHIAVLCFEMDGVHAELLRSLNILVDIIDEDRLLSP